MVDTGILGELSGSWVETSHEFSPVWGGVINGLKVGASGLRGTGPYLGIEGHVEHAEASLELKPDVGLGGVGGFTQAN